MFVSYITYGGKCDGGANKRIALEDSREIPNFIDAKSRAYILKFYLLSSCYI